MITIFSSKYLYLCAGLFNYWNTRRNNLGKIHKEWSSVGSNISSRMEGKKIIAIKAADEEKKTFQWSFAFVLTWMKCIAIPLNWDESKNRCRISTFSALFVFLLNAESNLLIVVFTLSYISSPLAPFRYDRSITSTWIWNSVIDRMNFAFITLGPHFGLLAASFANWPLLVRTFRRLEMEKHFLTDNDFKKFRKSSAVALIFMIEVSQYLGQYATRIQFIN